MLELDDRKEHRAQLKRKRKHLRQNDSRFLLGIVLGLGNELCHFGVVEQYRGYLSILRKPLRWPVAHDRKIIS
jgi:hypothetical protein